MGERKEIKTWEDLEKVALQTMELGNPLSHKKGVRGFITRTLEKLMNKWGWHRKYQIAIFNSKQFDFIEMNKPIKLTTDYRFSSYGSRLFDRNWHDRPVVTDINS